MGSGMKRTILYGVLLTAGVTLGMQLSEPKPEASRPIGGTDGTDLESETWNERDHISDHPANEVYTFITPDGKKGYFLVPQQSGSTASQTSEVLGQLYSLQEAGINGFQTPSDLLLPDPEAPAVDRLADKTANLLQQLSRRSIHWVASWFDSKE